jgi:hypothetical protein
MRASDLTEGRGNSKSTTAARALPATYTIPKLPNQDPYRQYRFGVAIAAAKGRSVRAQEGDPEFDPESSWGENEIIVSYGADASDWIDDALKMVGLTPADKKLVSTKNSQEASDVAKNSPVRAFKGYPR